ncbi:MAG: hypothetical protein WEA09_06860 [Gemmatimonadota bacterium]
MTRCRPYHVTLGLGLAIILTSACYSTIPVRLEAVSPGQELTVHLDAETSQRLSLAEGYSVRYIAGRLDALRGDSLTVSIAAGQRVQGMLMNPTRRNFNLARQDVVLVEQREFDRGRSALLAGGIIGGIVATVLQARGGGGGSGDGGGEAPPPSPFVIPIPIFIR